MGKGYLTIHLTTAEAAMPVTGASVNILDMDGKLLYALHTDESGLTERVGLDAPPAKTQLDPSMTVKPYSRYIVEITADGFNKVVINGVQIYDESESTLPIDMHPGQPSQSEEYEVGENALEMPDTRQDAPPSFIMPRIHREVFIPTHITVHLGIPASNARNVTVPFIDYVKNVASAGLIKYHSAYPTLFEYLP